MDWSPLEVVLWGDYACFTRPEMKVERVSYPIMTPSAARGALEAIYRKPEFHWEVREIHALKPVQWFSIKRNEVSSKISYSAAKGWRQPRDGYFADADRTQRAGLLLRDVRYLVKADIILRPHADKDIAAYRDQFRRRVAKGACFHRPCLGCREFSANFAEPTIDDTPCDWTEDLGRMLFDIDFDPPVKEHLKRGTKEIFDGERKNTQKSFKCPGTGSPVFFDAKIEEGVMSIPEAEYTKLRWTREGEGWE